MLSPRSPALHRYAEEVRHLLEEEMKERKKLLLLVAASDPFHLSDTLLHCLLQNILIRQNQRVKQSKIGRTLLRDKLKRAGKMRGRRRGGENSVHFCIL